MPQYVKTSFKKRLWDEIAEDYAETEVEVEATISHGDVTIEAFTWGPACISEEAERELALEAAEHIHTAYVGKGRWE